MRTELKTLMDLRDFIETLTPEQQSQPIKFWGDLVSGTVNDVSVLDEDYINPSGEGCEPVSAYLSEGPEYLSGEEISYPKGTVIFGVEHSLG